MSKLRIAHLSGPTATIQNTPPLVTSNKARAKYGLPLRNGPDGSPLKYDALRPQRLAASVRVYVEQFSAHPLESDAAELYAAPDAYISADGSIARERRSAEDRPVFEVELHPEDGWYPLPYMARQANGRAWEEECAEPGAPAERARQGFLPDGSRSFDEIDRLGVGPDGLAGSLSSLADIAFYRVLPPAGYTKGLPEAARTDVGAGDIPPEQRGKDFFYYKPRHLASPPPRPALAKITNDVHTILTQGAFDGAIWTQGSPNIEDTCYWLNLLIDTKTPIACNAAQRPHGEVSNDGPRNILDSVHYVRSRVWADPSGGNRLGTVLIQDQQFFAAREVAKSDARPGGYVATGGLGGVLGQIDHDHRCEVKYVPAYKHTHLSDVRLTQLPERVEAVRTEGGKLSRFDVRIRDPQGLLFESAIPSVSIIKDGGYCGLDWSDDPEAEGDLRGLLDHKLSIGALAGFIVEGTAPTGNMTSRARFSLTMEAVFTGLPVVRVGRGTPNGFAGRHPFMIAGSNLTATKARLLLMAALMKYGSLPSAADPSRPTEPERESVKRAVALYQEIFDTH